MANRQTRMSLTDATGNDFWRPVGLELLDNIPADPVVLKPGTLPGHGLPDQGPRLSTVPQITIIDPGPITTDFAGDRTLMPAQGPGNLAHRSTLTTHNRNPFPLPHRELKVIVFHSFLLYHISFRSSSVALLN